MTRPFCWRPHSNYSKHFEGWLSAALIRTFPLLHLQLPLRHGEGRLPAAACRGSRHRTPNFPNPLCKYRGRFLEYFHFYGQKSNLLVTETKTWRSRVAACEQHCCLEEDDDGEGGKGEEGEEGEPLAARLKRRWIDKSPLGTVNQSTQGAYRYSLPVGREGREWGGGSAHCGGGRPSLGRANGLLT